MAEKRSVKLHWVHTSDVHGSLVMWDFLKHKPTKGGLSAVYAYVSKLRREHPGAVILTDGGDCLQGQPLSYYYNYIATDEENIASSLMNELEYDAGVIGNHDIETGHKVYDKWIKELNFPLLGANVIDENTGQSYLQPYNVVNREGVRIAILGMVTNAIPYWVPKRFREGLRFDDVLSSTKFWIDRIKKEVKPDLLVLAIHSGLDGGISTTEYKENVVKDVVAATSDIDFVLYGHDHMFGIHKLHNSLDKEVYAISPSSTASRIVDLEIDLELEDDLIVSKRFVPHIRRMNGTTLPEAILLEEEYGDKLRKVENWLDEELGYIDNDLHERDSFFGPSAFMSFIHQMQFSLSSAEVSFSAPINYDSTLHKGTVTIRDMFNLYKYDNFLYEIRMTGREIKGFLEYSYSLWVNQMSSADDHALLLEYNMDDGKRMGLKNFAFNFEAAAGFVYMVDLTKPYGERVNITLMRDGSRFCLDGEYRVVTNSYRGSGGGELMTKGAGIPLPELPERIIKCSDHDIRSCFMEYVRKRRFIKTFNYGNWQFVPANLVVNALKRDRETLFPDEKEVKNLGISIK